MPGGLPPLASRLLALALLVALGAFGWLYMAQPVIARLHDTRAQIEQTRELLARYRAVNVGHAGLEAELTRWREEVLPKSGVFPGSKPPLVAAELQSVVSGIVKAHDGDLLSIQILREQGDGRQQAVSVRVQFTADVESLTNIFHDLESAKPYLFLENLQIRAGRVARRSRIARVRAQAAEVDTLFVTCDVQGYMRGEPS